MTVVSAQAVGMASQCEVNGQFILSGLNVAGLSCEGKKFLSNGATHISGVLDISTSGFSLSPTDDMTTPSYANGATSGGLVYSPYIKVPTTPGL